MSDDDSPPPVDSTPGELAAGERFAERYEIERTLGAGGSGVVYVARVIAGPPSPAAESGDRLVVGDRVALKVLHEHLVFDAQVPRRFAREARILRCLSGPHVTRLLDYGETPAGQLFMALELVDGVSLDRIAARAPMDPSRAVAIARQICRALAAAHAVGVVHRDLKPVNVIIEQRDGGDHVRVLDFGMAKILRGELQNSLNALTQQNMVFGTPEYMAPEQACGEEVDERCDLYATGVLLYELITGTLPFQQSAPIALMTAHLADDPEPPSRRAPQASIPPALEGVVLHALAKRPELRYPTAVALEGALASALARPLDTTSIIPPASRHELERRDTDPFLQMAAALRRTAREAATATPSPVPTPPLPRRYLWLTLIAVAAGILFGLVMSLSGAPR